MPSIALENPHHHFLQRQLPLWAQHAVPSLWHRLLDAVVPAQGTLDNQAAWFANAAPDLREVVQASQTRLMHSQRALARALKGLKNIAEFAEPLLAQALLSQHQFSASLRTTELIHIHHLFTWETYVNSSERRSLLEAALHNFEEDVQFSRESALALAGDIQVEKTNVIGKAPLGDSETRADITLDSETYHITPLSLAPKDFARTCRELDLGQLYQDHLSTHLSPAHIATLTTKLHQDRLRLAADIAYLRLHINGAAQDSVHAMLSDDTSARCCSQLSVFDIVLHEALVIDLNDAGLLLYLPGQDAELQQFDSLLTLHDHLRDALLSPEVRQRFLAYMPHDQQATFLSRLRQNLDADDDTPLDQTWPLRAEADLHLSWIAIDGQLYTFLHQDALARLLAEARQIAVPTAEVDEQERKRRLALWESVSVNTLMLAGMFIPAVGALMIYVIAYQLLDEAYEGYQAWSVGDRHLAMRHLQAIGLNLAVIGGVHVAGKVLPKLFNSALMENLDPVTLPDGNPRLWKPDLVPYRSAVQLPESLKGNAQGQYRYQGRYYIRLEGAWYEQGFDADLQRWRIVHPTDAQAYQPRLEHNAEGSWRVEHEQPQYWSPATLVRRLDHRLEGFNNEQLKQAMRISGISAEQLRYMHLANDPIPTLLADTLQRMSIERQVQRALIKTPGADAEALFEQLYNGSPLASPAQARLIAQYPRISVSMARRLLARPSPSELLALDGQTSLPAWLQHVAEQLSSDLPLARALEGLALPRLSGSDTERLALLALQRLPGWSSSLRLELRAGSAEGPVLAEVGASDAAIRRVLIKSAAGYEPVSYDTPRPGKSTTDLCTAIVRALPAKLRQGMGLEQAAGEALRLRLLKTVNADRRLWTRRLFKPANGWPKQAGLRGGAPLDPTPPANSAPHVRSSLIARYRRLFPNAGDQQIQQLFSQWQRETRFISVELQALEDRLEALHRDLRLWAGNLPRRQRAIRTITNAWRRISTQAAFDAEQFFQLDLAHLELEDLDIVELALPDDFQHVQTVDLSGNPALSSLPAEFLERFPQLNCLYLRNCRFSRIPQVASPQELNWLDLEGNRITWDAWNQVALDRLQNLDMLDLSGNPLIESPSLYAMSRLRSLHLANCSLTQLPEGIATIEAPTLINLEDNQFQSLPRHFHIPRAHGAAMRLLSEALSPAMREQITTYYMENGVDLMLADSDYDELLEGISAVQRALWERLPLDFRRDLCSLLEEDDYIADPQGAQAAVWARLERMDRDADYFARAVDLGADHLLQLPLD
ncbi:MAG: leucine-rich repeat domain-containing protein [Pseudomonas sp.]